MIGDDSVGENCSYHNETQCDIEEVFCFLPLNRFFGVEIDMAFVECKFHPGFVVAAFYGILNSLPAVVAGGAIGQVGFICFSHNL